MRDKGIQRGLVQSFDTSNINTKGSFWGFRKMFRDYLNKLGVGFSDSCCPDANDKLPVYINKTTGKLTYINSAGVPTVITILP